MRTVRVIPAFRAPRTIAGFDYIVPKGQTIRVGDLVRIPFRKQHIVGVVAEELAQPTIRKELLKEVIGPYANLRLSAKTLTLLQKLAVRSLSSPASVLHAWMGTLPKRPTIAEVTGQSKHVTFTAPDGLHLHTDHWHHPHGVIATATNALAAGQRVLILTPWTARAHALAQECNGTALTSDLNDGDRFRAWSGFIQGTIRCIVATRIGAWLTTEADVVIVDEPENDDHKQDELAPRYDARWLAAEAKKQGIAVTAIGLTPRIGATATIPPIDTSITWVDTHRADWSGVAGIQGRALLAIEDALAAHHPVTIIHPIHGIRARLRCADCGWSAACARCGNGLTPQHDALQCTRCNAREPMPAACPRCSGTDFSKSRPGRDTLTRDLHRRDIMATILSLGEWNTASVRLDPQSLVVLTDLSLLPGGGEDLRRRERLIIAFRRLADICASQNAHLVIQGDAALLDDARTWLTSEGCSAALKREWDERTAFHLPPATRLVKLLVRGSGAPAEKLLATLRPRLPSNASLAGPFSVERLPGTRTPRAVIHLTLPPETTDNTIHRLISPVLTADTLVDLDPIALYE